MATYRRVSCFLVVEEDDAESTIEQFNVALDAIRGANNGVRLGRG